jgi:hypothetical protein
VYGPNAIFVATSLDELSCHTTETRLRSFWQAFWVLKDKGRRNLDGFIKEKLGLKNLQMPAVTNTACEKIQKRRFFVHSRNEMITFMKL